eukprot:82143-Chlamydomonas_euryale.AAC.1
MVMELLGPNLAEARHREPRGAFAADVVRSVGLSTLTSLQVGGYGSGLRFEGSGVRQLLTNAARRGCVSSQASKCGRQSGNLRLLAFGAQCAVCLALLSAQGMHEAGYVHRDVKPANFALHPATSCVLQGFGEWVGHDERARLDAHRRTDLQVSLMR